VDNDTNNQDDIFIFDRKTKKINWLNSETIKYHLGELNGNYYISSDGIANLVQND
jgi:hypothetical protein